ncbi:MAG: hypothetical protein QOG23_4051 [Blastocatellia bacterium]|jgi:uncharacterized protein (TIGR02246 family)|nr:hypothetical protein [Blastocatellia bacterium]
MADDKQQIRDLIDTWNRASAAGDISKILSLMDEEAVFLRASHPPMRGREAFAAQFKQAIEQVRIEATSDVQEIDVSDDMAYCWNELSVTMTPLKGGTPMRHSGPVLTIFRKKADGTWVLSRDANLLADESSGKN